MKQMNKAILLSLTALMLTGVSVQAKERNTHRIRKHTPQQKQQYAGWYMRTKVYATTEDSKEYSHTTAGIFGKLKQSKWKKDQHDIPAFTAATFQVVFPHLNWRDDSGDYYSNYYKWNKYRKNKRAVWTFQVKNQRGADLSNASLRIVLEGAQNVDYVEENRQVKYIETTEDPQKKERLTLVDVDNHETYDVDELEYADLSMDGKHTRTFRWVMGRVKKRDFRPLPEPK